MDQKPHIRSVIASNVKKYRKLRQLTQENLAEMADVSNTYIANIECGQTWVSDKTLEKIAKALNVEIYLLFVPDETKTADSGYILKQQDLISYIGNRQNELNLYIKNFFSETFEHVLNDMKS